MNTRVQGRPNVAGAPPVIARRSGSALERLEIVAAVLLAVAAVATAWSSYQAARWNGEQAKASARANTLRIESAKADARSNTFGSIDVNTFTQWMNAKETGDASLAAFYESRFRSEFKPAFNAWLATNPFSNPNAPTTPFQMSEYVRADETKARALDAQADASVNTALADLERSSNYVLCVVLFAASLFFAGVSTRFAAPASRRVALVCGTIVFIGTLAWLVTFPVSFSI